MELATGYIDSLAPNGGAASSGRALAKDGSFVKLHISPDKTLLFGECAGSGKNPYACSMDFLEPAAPVPRCNCPSRQIPCKHVLGLMYAYAGGKPFAEAEIPEGVIDKRAGAAKRAGNKEKKKQESMQGAKADKKPGKAKIAAAIKKISLQLDGIETAQTLLKNIVQTGLAGLDARARAALQTQSAELGNCHIKGIQAAFNDLLLCIGEKDADYGAGAARLIYLHVLLKKAREHLAGKKERGGETALELDTSSEIEEQIGHVWKLEELRAAGRCMESAALVQLSFNVEDDRAKKEFVDTGLFICLQDGRICAAKNYRPYKSAKYISRADTVFGKVTVNELYIYPGGMNPRIRYDKCALGPIEPADYAAIRGFAQDDFAETARAVKNQIKSPLADKNPAALLKISAMSKVCDGEGRAYVQITDGKGAKQLLCGAELLCMLDFGLLAGNAALVAYENNIETGLLAARPLAVVTDSGIIRLEY